MTVPGIEDALRPVCEALLAAARRDADRVLRSARTRAEELVADAVRRASAIRDEARCQGEADAAAAVTAERAAARRSARAAVLHAQRDAYEQLRSAARVAVAALREAPDYPALRAGLVAWLHRALGPDAEVRDLPDGGVAGGLDGRRVDYSLAGFADRAVDAVLAEGSVAS